MHMHIHTHTVIPTFYLPKTKFHREFSTVECSHKDTKLKNKNKSKPTTFSIALPEENVKPTLA